MQRGLGRGGKGGESVLLLAPLKTVSPPCHLVGRRTGVLPLSANVPVFVKNCGGTAGPDRCNRLPPPPSLTTAGAVRLVSVDSQDCRRSHVANDRKIRQAVVSSRSRSAPWTNAERQDPRMCAHTQTDTVCGTLVLVSRLRLVPTGQSGDEHQRAPLLNMCGSLPLPIARHQLELRATGRYSGRRSSEKAVPACWRLARALHDRNVVVRCSQAPSLWTSPVATGQWVSIFSAPEKTAPRRPERVENEEGRKQCGEARYQRTDGR